jgi:adenylosuccinate synthase
MQTQNKVDVVLGAQLGDEGKGRLIDILASNYDIVARCNSGGNAGHKVVVNGNTYAFHLVPSGILNPKVICIIGNGCVINLADLQHEIETIQSTNPNDLATNNITSRLLISDRAHIVIDLHKQADSSRELVKSAITNKSIGTTKQGMGPVYATKALRVGLRMCDLFLEYSQLLDKVIDLVNELNLCLKNDNI